eukprot:1161785-Pelagomonas_calceolata.AAC.11
MKGPLHATYGLQVKDLKESIAINERALADVSNTGATFKRQQASVMEKFQRLEHQVRVQCARLIMTSQHSAGWLVDAAPMAFHDIPTLSWSVAGKSLNLKHRAWGSMCVEVASEGSMVWQQNADGVTTHCQMGQGGTCQAKRQGGGSVSDSVSSGAEGAGKRKEKPLLDKKAACNKERSPN